MTAPEPRPGLRERKKIQTRARIRREALGLIQEQGYQATTVEQISDAADISPRTFSRYFSTKEAVLLSVDHIPPIIEAFIAAPAHLSVIDAYRQAVETTFAALDDDAREEAIVGQRLMYSVPEAAGLIYTEYVRLIGPITDALTQRPDAPTDPVERRVLAGAIVGVLIGASHGTPLPGDPISTSLRVLDRMLR
ncbi:TetR family transcriptional regulator [Mycolicibacterium flavescens]|uniref:TetR family transcriptional regulator n=1 Tax=Mycolicibacterium flavescens TaxID=1776 RepID=A0A1E3RFX2_MYCFV|nr:TetR family transcriptional regulator [Mycolicibacterium flavescens]MCV7282832.1 TetR family transcriptional regulator [Mycolicibacterium flavescens]ODQ88739.1 TetR family transcriptional regulator [Mycolicibacterium flavescens]